MGSIYGYEIESDLPLRRLRSEPGVRGGIRLERGPEDMLDQPCELLAWHGWPGVEQSWFALARTARGLLASWTLAGTFEIDLVTGGIRVVASRFGSRSEHRLATMVIPLLLASRGDLALHAAGISVGGRAVLFCGPSGRGKSTLALFGWQLGHEVLSEDGSIVELQGEGRVWPGVRGVVVESDRSIARQVRAGGAANGGPAASPRRRDLRLLPAEREAAEPAPLAAICQVAERGVDLNVRRLSPTEAIPVLAPNLIHAGSVSSFRAAFSLLARLVQETPVYRISMPDRMSRAPAATAAVLDQVAS
jgi:hypothetical protein